MTTYEKLAEALHDLDLTDAKHYGAELERENAKLREALKWAEPYVPKVCETRRMIEDILSNA